MEEEACELSVDHREVWPTNWPCLYKVGLAWKEWVQAERAGLQGQKVPAERKSVRKAQASILRGPLALLQLLSDVISSSTSQSSSIAITTKATDIVVLTSRDTKESSACIVFSAPRTYSGRFRRD